jgi:hypothetical protein
VTEYINVNSSDIVTLKPVLLYDSRQAGAGKTYSECESIVQKSGRYVFAVELLTAITERRATLEEMAERIGTRVTIIEVSSKDPSPRAKRGRAVKVEIEALPNTYTAGHVIALVTHAGLMNADLSSFDGWTLVIDEVPSIFESKAVVSGLSWPVLKTHFRIVQGDELNTVMSSEASRATNADFSRDSMTSALATFHRRVSGEQYDVYTDVSEWDRLAVEPNWRWSSFWSPVKLQAFRSVKILAHGFDRSLTFAAFQARNPELVWCRDERPTTRTFARRKMTIHFFARGHRASRGLFDTVTGKGYLQTVARWIKRDLDGEDQIWTCNDADLKSLNLMSGLRLSPRQAGSNRYQAIHAVSAIYTAKPDPAECQVLETFGIDTNTAIATREYETLYQFIGRSSVRDASSTRGVRVFVYDRDQATYLAEAFGSAGYVDVELLPIDLGFIDAPYDPKPGRPKVELTGAEMAVRADKKRAQDRERQKAKRARDKMAQNNDGGDV